MFKKTLGLLAATGTVVAGFNIATAEPEATPSTATTAVIQQTSKATETDAEVEARLRQFYGIEKGGPRTIRKSPVDNIWEVFTGDRYVYVDSSGRYTFAAGRDGIMLRDQATGKNLTEEAEENRTRPIALSVLKRLAVEDTIVYKPEVTKHVLTVFTDTNCYYCQLLHNNVPEYLKLGIEVRYMLLPLRQSGEMAESVWCAADRATALTTAKRETAVASQMQRSGLQPPPSTIETKKCDNPIGKHIGFARELGVSGTPNMITESGTIIGGYIRDTSLLVKMLEEEKANAKTK